MTAHPCANNDKIVVKLLRHVALLVSLSLNGPMAYIYGGLVYGGLVAQSAA
jgi:hypothetical protein